MKRNQARDMVRFFNLKGQKADNQIFISKTQWVARLTQEPEVQGLILCLATYFHFSFHDSRRAVVIYWLKYVH